MMLEVGGEPCTSLGRPTHASSRPWLCSRWA